MAIACNTFLAAVLVACATSGPGPAAAGNQPMALSGPQAGANSLAADSLPATPRPSTFLLGSGEFVAKPTDKTSIGSGDGKGIQLSFVDTDIRTVLNSILGDALAVSYTIDPSIKGTITVQSARPLQKDELLNAIEAALSVQDIAMVSHGDSYDVVPAKDAQKKIRNLRLPDSTAAPGFGVQIVPLRYTGAEEMSRLLEPFAPQGAVVRTDNSRNLLVLAGTSQELASLTDIVQTFDVDWLAGMSYAFFPVEYADAKAVTEELNQIFGEQKSPLSGVVRLIPLSRLNTILVASPQREYLQKVGDWIKRLDLGNSSPGRRIYVYDVQNGKASDLADTLGQIFGTGGSSRYSASQTSGATNSFSSEFGSSAGTGAAAFSGMQGGQGFGASGSQGFGQQSSFQQSPGNTRSSFGSPGSGAGSSLETAGLRIVPDEATNALLILATPSEFGVIDSAIKRLDVAPRQVLIEASLAEVTLNNEIKFGVEWAFHSSTGTASFSPNSNGGISSQFPGLSYFYTGASSISAVLNALETITTVKVLSSPKLLVLNNHEAEIQVGDQVPILTQQAVSTSQTSAPIVNSVQQRDTGVILHVTPRVNQSGMVIMDIGQEVSTVVPTTTSNIDSPTIQERRVSSTVAVHDGETIALGGLITDHKSNSKSGIPWFQRLPVVGLLFGTTDYSKDRTELIILIKPRVIRDPAEQLKVMDDLHQQFRSVEEQTGQRQGTGGKPAS